MQKYEVDYLEVELASIKQTIDALKSIDLDSYLEKTPSPIAKLSTIPNSEKNMDKLDQLLLGQDSLPTIPENLSIDHSNSVNVFMTSCKKYLNIIDGGISQTLYLKKSFVDLDFPNYYLAKFYVHKACFIRGELWEDTVRKLYNPEQLENKFAIFMDCVLQAYDLLIPLLKKFGKSYELMYQLGILLDLPKTFINLAETPKSASFVQKMADKIKNCEIDYTNPYQQIGCYSLLANEDGFEKTQKETLAKNLNVIFNQHLSKEIQEVGVRIILKMGGLNKLFVQNEKMDIEQKEEDISKMQDENENLLEVSPNTASQSFLMQQFSFLNMNSQDQESEYTNRPFHNQP